MAIYHCSIKIIKRSQGRSAVAAAYRSGTRLVNEWDGLTHDYTKKGGVIHSEIMLPAHAPEAFSERSALWNSVERSEKSRDAQLAREIEVALPNELPHDEHLKLVRAYCSSFAQEGMCVDFSIHDPKGEQRNVHAHILLTLRALKENGEWAGKCRKEYDVDERGQRIPDGKGGWKNHRVNLTDWNDPDKAEEWRAAWAALVNQALERNGIHERVDHRSYKRQGLAQLPTIHMGVAASQMEKRGIRTEKGNVNREIMAQNRLLKEIKARLTRLYLWSKELEAEQEAQPDIIALLKQAQADIQSKHSATHYGKARALKEHAALVAFLQENQIASLDELHAKVKAMQSDYYDLRGEIVADERAIAALQERLTMWAQYNDNREHAKRGTTLRSKGSAPTEHSTEKALYEAAARYLADLKDKGERITPKRWNAELARLTAHKDALYGQMKGMRVGIQAAERIRKAAEKLAREANPPLNREEMR